MRDVRAKFGIPYLPQSHESISNSRIPGQSLIKRNCHNSRTSDDIDMKLGPVTKLGKRNKITSKRFDDDVMSKNHDFAAICPIYSQFGAIRKPDLPHMFYKINILSLIATFYFTKNGNKTKKSRTQLPHYCFE